MAIKARYVLPALLATGAAAFLVHRYHQPLGITPAFVEKTGLTTTMQYTDTPGDPTQGTVYSIGQVHQISEKSGKTASTNYRVVTAIYQAKIFNELHNRGIKHVFSEGIDQQDLEEIMTTHNRDAARAHYGENKELTLETFTWQDIDALYEGTGATYYALTHDEVTLHPIPYDRAKMNDVIKSLTAAEPNEQCLGIIYLFTTHEDVVVHEAEKFLRTHPGETIAIVYGFIHDLQDNFSLDFHPVFHRGSFFSPASGMDKYNQDERAKYTACISK